MDVTGLMHTGRVSCKWRNTMILSRRNHGAYSFDVYRVVRETRSANEQTNAVRQSSCDIITRDIILRYYVCGTTYYGLVNTAVYTVTTMFVQAIDHINIIVPRSYTIIIMDETFVFYCRPASGGESDRLDKRRDGVTFKTHFNRVA